MANLYTGNARAVTSVDDEVGEVDLSDDYQPLDSDLTAIAALAPTDGDMVRRESGVWVARSMTQIKTALALVKADVGLGLADNTPDLDKPVSTATQAALDAKVAAATQIATTAPLTGGGDLSANRTLGISVGPSGAEVAEGRAPRFFNAPVPISGRYVYTGYGANATVTPTLNQTRYMAFPVWDAWTASAIGVEVTTLQASSVIRLGLWADTGTNLPGALITDFGTVSGAAAQAVTITPPGGILFSARTMYWLSATVQTAGGTVALRAANYHDPLVLPNSLNVLATVVSGYGQAGVTGALAGPAVPADGVLAPRFMLLCA